MSQIEDKLAQFTCNTQFKDIPAPVVQRVKEVVFDTVGVALGAYVTERAKIAIALSESFGTKPEATIIGYKKASSPSASFVNGELINALDYDVIGPIGGHVVPYVLPCTLALCEKSGRSGQDLITALAVAIEIGGRMLGSLSHLKIPKKEPPYYEHAPRFSYTSTVFGAVAGACRALELKPEQVTRAFGVGGTSTPIPGGQKWEYLEGPSINLKYGCWTGWLSMLGATSALATEKGFLGDANILEGKYGFWQMYGSPFFKEDVLTKDLGKVWHLEGMSFKYYPCCYIDHTSIEAVSNIVRENNIQPDDIDDITVYGDAIMLTPNRAPAEMTTNEDSQFSNAYLFAIAATGKKPGPEWALQEMPKDPQIKRLMSKVQMKLHPRAAELTAEKLKISTYSTFRNVLCEITAKGKKFTTEVAVPKGEPTKKLTAAELDEKFQHNAVFSMLRRDRVNQAAEAIWKLDKLASVEDLMGLLRTD